MPAWVLVVEVILGFFSHLSQNVEHILCSSGPEPNQ